MVWYGVGLAGLVHVRAYPVLAPVPAPGPGPSLRILACRSGYWHDALDTGMTLRFMILDTGISEIRRLGLNAVSHTKPILG